MPVRKVKEKPQQPGEATAEQPQALAEQPHQITDETGAVVAELSEAEAAELKAAIASAAAPLVAAEETTEAPPAAGEQIAPGVQDDGTPTPPAKGWTVRALQAFGDARTNRSYKVGDVVRGWDAARASRYAARGLVVIEEASDERADHGDDGGDAGPGA